MKNEIIRYLNIQVDGIDERDYPDFCDAFISDANVELEDGTIRQATDEELETLNEDSEFVYQCVMDYLY